MKQVIFFYNKGNDNFEQLKDFLKNFSDANTNKSSNNTFIVEEDKEQIKKTKVQIELYQALVNSVDKYGVAANSVLNEYANLVLDQIKKISDKVTLPFNRNIDIDNTEELIEASGYLLNEIEQESEQIKHLISSISEIGYDTLDIDLPYKKRDYNWDSKTLLEKRSEFMKQNIEELEANNIIIFVNSGDSVVAEDLKLSEHYAIHEISYDENFGEKPSIDKLLGINLPEAEVNDEIGTQDNESTEFEGWEIVSSDDLS